MLVSSFVRDWMTGNVVTVSPDTPITTAHSIMKKNNIRRLPVTKADKLLGIVTIGDVREAEPSGATTLSIWEINHLWSQIQVKDVMTKNIMTVKDDEPMINAATIMLENKISSLPVMDESGQVVGMLTESDIFRMLIKTLTEG
jgi:acetoin utilization protein AcuB